MIGRKKLGRKDSAAPDIGLKHNEMAKIDRKKDGRQELLLHSSHFLCKQKKKYRYVSKPKQPKSSF